MVLVKNPKNNDILKLSNIFIGLNSTYNINMFTITIIISHLTIHDNKMTDMTVVLIFQYNMLNILSLTQMGLII